MVGLGSALAATAGALGKVAVDVILLAQTEVAEVAEAGGDGRSSTMPQKRNPIASTLAAACVRQAQAHAAVLPGSMVHEHERAAAGAWHAEWEAVTGALGYTGGAASFVREAIEGLEVDAERMRANLDSTGAVMAEHVSLLLSQQIGRVQAHELVGAAARRSAAAGLPLEHELLEDGEVRAHLSEQQIVDALDPARYLGSSQAFIDRALELHRSAADA
jgi:3-carboxy-cis,cis-muconate cycloisomerase